MSFCVYFDLTLVEGSPAPGQGTWDGIGKLMRQLHGASARTGVPFAVAFPGWMEKGFTLGRKLRVWGESKEAIESLYDAWDATPGATDIAEGGRVRAVMAPTEFEAFLMHRLPSGISKEERSVPMAVKKELQAKARLRRIAQQSVLPSVAMQSSSGNRFRLVIEKIAAEGGEGGKPNGYGLSRKTQVVALPVVS